MSTIQNKVDLVLDASYDQMLSIILEAYKTEDWAFVMADYLNLRDTAAKFNFIVAVEKETKKVVASVMLTCFHSLSGEEAEDLYSIGWYYVIPAWRKGGVGSLIFNKAMEIANNGTAQIYLSGVVSMIDRYANKYGFKLMYTYMHNESYVKMNDLVVPPKSNSFETKNLTEVNAQTIHNYDRKICERERSKFLERFYSGMVVTGRAVFDSGGVLVGFGCIRIFNDGSLGAGPIFAESLEAARALMWALLTGVRELRSYKHVSFIWPETNIDAKTLLDEISGGKVDTKSFTRCQFNKKIIEPPASKVFAVMNQDCCYV